jgi:cellulose synthase operon protein C
MREANPEDLGPRPGAKIASVVRLSPGARAPGRWPVWRSWVRAGLAAVVVIGVVGAALFWQREPRGRSFETFDRLLADGRPLQARLTFAEVDLHRPYRARPASAPRPGIERLMARLERAGKPSGMVAAMLLAGGVDQARALARPLPLSPDVESDRAAVELEAKRPAEALALLEPAVARSPNHPQALWNTGLARELLRLPLAAAESFDAVARLGEPGWAAEARTRAAGLRAGYDQQRRLAATLEAAVSDLRRLYRLPDAALVARAPELWRQELYEALRSARGAGRLEALSELAASLDRLFGGGVLLGHVQSLLREPMPAEPTALLLAAPSLTEDQRDTDRTVLLAAIDQARKLGDLWLEIRGQGALALRDAQAGEAPAATERLAALVERCLTTTPFRRLCEEQRLWMSWAQDFRHMFAEATETSQIALKNARALGDARLAQVALARLGQHAAGQLKPALVRAYLVEASAIRPASCEIRGLKVLLLANIAFREGSLDRVREEMKAGFDCPENLGLAGANALRALVVAGGTHAERELLMRVLASLRGKGRLTPARRLILDALEARLIAPTPSRMLASLRSLRPAGLALADDDWSETARLMIHLPLIADAIGRRAHREALEHFFSMYKTPPPAGDRCWLALAVDGKEALVVARSRTLASQVLPAERLLSGGHAWLDDELRGALARCPAIDVLASGDLYGRSGLLPLEWAWAYSSAVLRSSPPPPGPSRVRLVVADVPARPDLGLPPLARWRGPPQAGGPVIYRGGAAATPTEVARRLQEADEIDFHVHGHLDPEVSPVPYLVLAPEPGGRYALTAEAVRKLSLRDRAPVVLLAACEAGKKTAGARAGWSMPRAFLEAGARAVIAAPTDLPDVEAGKFFAEISAELGRTPRAALAVQRVRLRWAKARPAGEEPWIDSVVVFEG